MNNLECNKNNNKTFEKNMEKDNLFSKNFRKGIISIAAINVLLLLFLIISSNSIDITGYLFIISGMLLNTFISGRILFRYLEKNINREIKNVIIVSLIIYVIIFVISYTIFEICLTFN
jgi:hypothetical protein